MSETETTRRKVPKGAGIMLWIMAPLLAGLSVWRPVHEKHVRAPRVPDQILGFAKVQEQKITEGFVQLLGTRDATWRTYRDAKGNEVYMVAVFHDENWKSLHPPHICIRGTNFEILQDSSIDLKVGDRTVTIGRIAASRKTKTSAQGYLSYYAFVGSDFVTPSYVGFFLEHAPRALLRSATPGFLLRVESFVGRDGVEATAKRCTDFFRAALPIGEGLIR